MEWITAKNALDGRKTATKSTMALDCLKGIG